MHPVRESACEAKGNVRNAKYLIPIHKVLPHLDEPLAYHILIVGASVRVFVEDIRYILIDIRKKIAKLRPHELIEQLLNADLHLNQYPCPDIYNGKLTLSVDSNFDDNAANEPN